MISPMLKALFFRFFSLGLISFGGPAAHIALFEREFVRRKKELSHEEFMSLMALTQIIPGPNSTEMTQLLGYRQQGWRGLWLAGLGFILPAFLIVLAISWIYQMGQQIPWIQSSFTGLTPIILALLVSLLWNLRRQMFGNLQKTVLFICAISMVIAQVPILIVLISIALINDFGQRLRQNSTREVASLFWAFLKIGSLLYGSGYVLFAYLEKEFGAHSPLGFLSQQQLYDAIAIGQITPGPLFTSATFVGFLHSGLTGAIAATVGIFLPSFIATQLCAPWWSKKALSSDSPRVQRWVEGLNSASLALLAQVTALSIWNSLPENLKTQPANIVNLSEAQIVLSLAFLGSLGLFAFSKVPTWLVLMAGLGLGAGLEWILQ